MATDATVNGAQAATAAEALEELRLQLRGEAYTPSDPGYADVRPVFNAMHTGEPDAGRECIGHRRRVDAVNFARDNGLAVAVRGGATRSPACRRSTAAC